jgi:Hypoxia induced protein conserved region
MVFAMLESLLDLIVPIAIGAVAVVLVLGLLNMMRGGSANTSQKLMRWRVLLQFVAIVVIMSVIWIKSH